MAGTVLRLLGQLVARKAEEVIVVSAHLAEYLPQRTYHVIPSGINPDLFRPIPLEKAREKLNLSLNKRLVLFAANPGNARKRYKLAQEGVALLNASVDAELIVANGVPYETMPLYMNACDVLLLTSMHEGSPNVVKEALACNLPVVSVDVGDVRQRIGPVAGCVVCPDDRPETIAMALEHVLERKGRVNGRSAVQDLDEHLFTQKVIAVYERALAR
jgi:glycosyltransferase involved in cell wall biosynthesis